MTKSKKLPLILKKKKAFALVMSLFLMGFLVVLVLTLSAIVQMELRSSKQTILDQRAKQAAKFAALQALGEVQKALGPDQRISANASILDTKLNSVFDELEDDTAYKFWNYDPAFNRNEITQIDGIANPHWLGVWDSTPGIYPMPRAAAEDRSDYSDRVLHYAANFLVSGNITIKRETPLPEDTLQLSYNPVDTLTRDYINMLRKNSITDESGDYNTSTMRVRVPLVTIPKTTEMESRSFLETRIAWWVSDESQKASIGALATEEAFEVIEDDDDRKTFMQALPYKNGMEALSRSSSSSGIFEIDLNNSDERDYVRRINELSQLDLLTSISSFSAGKLFYNSVSMSTKGLPVNVRNGGLKKDLTVGLYATNPIDLETDADFFDRPIGVEGYDRYLTNPTESGIKRYNVFEENSLNSNKKGHMFGPQDVDQTDRSYMTLDYSIPSSKTDDALAPDNQEEHMDPGGPLWDSLRDYYNNRVKKDGSDAYATTEENGYATKIRVKTDVTSGFSPVVLHYQLMLMPALTEYGKGYGVRIYLIPIIVLWNPYDVDIKEGTTYAFRHGGTQASIFGDFRVAIGYKDGDEFKAIRDIRTETMPRPLPNLANVGKAWYSYMSEKSASNPYYTAASSSSSGIFSSLYGSTAKNINFYRLLTFSSQVANYTSLTSNGYNDGQNTVKTGYDDYAYPFNKSYFGYGNWRYEDTQELVKGVEDTTNPYFPTASPSINDTGLVRIYHKVDATTRSTDADGKSMVTNDLAQTPLSIEIPECYYLSSESFFYRKLYLNNVLYSLAWTGQYKLSEGGSTDYSESTARTKMAAGNADSSLRFLVKCTEKLEAGAARIYTLKKSVPYHYEFNGSRGYAGDFEEAYDNDDWCLTEGVEISSIGGFFVDIMHPERTYLASTSNSYGTAVRPSYSASMIKEVELDPQAKCSYDSMELGVLFTLDGSRNWCFSDDAENPDNKNISKNDIYIDVDKWNMPAQNALAHITPWYARATIFNNNPWVRAGEKSSAGGFSASDQSDVRFIHGTASTEYQSEAGHWANSLSMWNYDDAKTTISNTYHYYKDEDGAVYEKPFQVLKRYPMVKNQSTPLVKSQSFPDPIRTVDGWVAGATETSATHFTWNAYFQSEYQMAAVYGNDYGTTDGYPSGTSEDSDGNEYSSNKVTDATNPALIEQGLFSDSGASYSSSATSYTTTQNLNYAVHTGYSSEVTLTEFGDLDLDKGARDKVRAKNRPINIGLSNRRTVYDGYYRNIMAYVNEQIQTINTDNNTDFALYSDSDDDYEKFLEDMDLLDKYDGLSWVWEDPYFLLANPRRISLARWADEGLYGNSSDVPTHLSADNLPKAIQPNSISASSQEGLSLDDIKEKVVIVESIHAYRPVSNELANANTDEFFYQYQFKFPWLNQSNVSAKNYADLGKADKDYDIAAFGNAGTFRPKAYGTNNTRHSSSYIYSFGGIENSSMFHSTESYGEKSDGGNDRIDEWVSYYIDRFNNSKGDGENPYPQVQIGPDVFAETGYKYTLRRILRSYEAVTSPADLSTADLSFGTEASRSWGVGTGTSDIYYPNNTIASSYAPMRIAPERQYDFIWRDSHVSGYYYIGKNKTTIDGTMADTEIIRHSYDMTWLLNDLIWDEYFFSALPYRSTEQDDLDKYYEYLIPKNPRIEYINKYKDRVYTRINDEMASIDSKVEDSNDLDYDYDANASRFWINGAFNVNSTNIDAWKMILATSFGNEIYGYDETYKSASGDGKAPFPRNGMPYTAEEFDEQSVVANEQKAMQGYRALDREELEELAMSMVENIKDRGPFFSLADFVNRSVELRSAEMRKMGTDDGGDLYDLSEDIWADPQAEYDTINENIDEINSANDFYLRQDHMQKGVIQAAIDLTTINQAFFNDAYLIDFELENTSLNSRYTKISSNSDYAALNTVFYSAWQSLTIATLETYWSNWADPRNVWENYRASLGSSLAGAPTYLTQADILKQIGSFITVRGDTFKIRAYGEIRNPLTDEIASKAWCELLVQRYPEYMDADDNVPTDVNNRDKELGYQGIEEYDEVLEYLEYNPANKYLGRRFKIVSFKWLSEREI
ncbi:MAG: hypothetical protein R3Y46_00535 [Opitutales bacterium]